MDCTEDEYGDNFYLDANEQSLKRSFKKIKKSCNYFRDNKITNEKIKELNKALFGSISPYSVFSDIIGFFENKSCIAQYKFRFMSGIMRDNLDDSVTHIFVEDNETSAIIKNVKAREQISAKIVKYI
ncbi:PREDICTED: uncharacterized protein LOC108758220 [Trachymyrmex cornetzi]|uniref:uncharacterized protein LOC108758220 n=1 Tax=Trachymyrmex cornetzi TaxID=471704 RepID=UPI00084EEE21|nr:PREDICTED: uncharacterized protein LOC108758220 [Trachymyrmex cornetzi]